MSCHATSRNVQLASPDNDRTQRIQNLAFQAPLAVARMLPYRLRVAFMGWIVAAIAAPLAGWTRRIEANLALVKPDWPQDRVRRLKRTVADNAGRTLIENFSTKDLLDRAKDTPVSGAGMEVLAKARSEGRPVILATGHFGNYEAARAALTTRGYEIGGLYRPLSNPYFNAQYKRTMEAFGGPVVPQGRRGTAAFIKALKEGRMMVLLFDLYVHEAPRIPFLGHPTRTATSAAEMALKYNAPLIPFYGIRQPDGVSFNVVVEEPIPHSDPETMTRALNESLEARINENPEQWFWIHQRWKDD